MVVDGFLRTDQAVAEQRARQKSARCAERREGAQCPDARGVSRGAIVKYSQRAIARAQGQGPGGFRWASWSVCSVCTAVGGTE